MIQTTGPSKFTSRAIEFDNSAITISGGSHYIDINVLG